MVKQEKMVELPPPNVPKLSKELSLTLADTDRMAHLFSFITSQWGKELIAHGKLGEESFGISAETTDLIGLVKEFGSLHEIEYISMSVPGKFILEFDFAKGKLFMRSNSPASLQQLEQQWKDAQVAIPLSQTMLPDVASSEARKFVINHIEKNGTLYQFGNTPVDLGRGYYLVALNALGLQVLLEKFAARLVSLQNEDGGWGRSAERKSDALSTANALLVLASTTNEPPNKPEAVERGKVFLLSKRLADGSWNVNWMRATGTALCLLALQKIGTRAPTLRKSLQFSRQGIQHELTESFHDIVLLEQLREAGVLSAERIGRLRRSGPLQGKSEREDTVRLATDLGLAIISNVSPGPRAVIQNELLALRNSDGGWPVKGGGRSELYPTVLALYVLGHTVKNKERVD